MALNKTYFESKGRDVSVPIPDSPGYTPPSPPTPPTPGSGTTPVIPRPTFSGSTSVTFYNNSSDNNVLNKSISSTTSATVVFKEDVDLIEPVLILQNNSYIQASNYMQMLGRYYYITSIECMPGNLLKVKASVDVLMSYRDQIRANSAIITRNANNVNTYLPDSKMRITSYTTVNTIQASAGFSNSLKYYLLAIGL